MITEAIEVEQPVTQLPPHRSLRADFPHRALQNCSLDTYPITKLKTHGWSSAWLFQSVLSAL